MGISIAHWLASLMWDFLLFCLLHITPSLYSIPPIVLCPWLALIYCVKVYRFEITKVWNSCLACHRGCAWLNTLCDEDRAIARLYDFVGITFFGHVILRRHNCFVSMLEVLLFLCQYELLSWIFRIWIFMPQLRRITLKLCQVALRIKNYLFLSFTYSRTSRN